MQQMKRLPKGYHVESSGVHEKLIREEDGIVVATVNLYTAQKLFQKEDFLMSMYESPDWKALEAFYSNVYWENQRRKQQGQGRTKG